MFQTTASESTFVCLLAARTEAIQRYQKEYPDLDDSEINSHLVAYCSDQVNKLTLIYLFCLVSKKIKIVVLYANILNKIG